VKSLRLAGMGAVLALAPLAASAHEVLHSVERGKAVAVKAYFADGEVLAYTQYEIYSPADPKIPMQKGRTDRNGYLAFVPDTAGKWRVKIVDDTGHGLDTQIDVGAAGQGGPGREQGGSALPTAAFVLRPIVGLAVIGAVFVALVLLRRRKGTTR
jgi:nickel transport protein